MSYKPVLGMSFLKDLSGIKYTSPRRPLGSLRDEFENDAKELSRNLGMVYICFSSGVDSQIIARCFIDNNLDAEYVFLHNKGYNDLELERVIECEKFYGITVRKIELDINKFKDAWLSESVVGTNYITQKPFEYLSSVLEESWPVVTQGKNEPCIVGRTLDSASIYHNYSEAMELRFSLMSKYRDVYDFPFSPEAIASYYTDENLKTFVSTISYFYDNGLSAPIGSHFNYYAKPFVKGKYFKDVIWYPKLSGTENYPEWMLPSHFSKETRISVPYTDLLQFLTTTENRVKIYNDWIYTV